MTTDHDSTNPVPTDAPAAAAAPDGPTRPRAVLVSGPPGSGKSTVGRLVAGRLGAALLDLDTATASLTAVIGRLHGTDDLDDPEVVRLTRAARYEAVTALAEDNLAAGTGVVLVAPFSAERRDPASWATLESRLVGAGAAASLVWLRISPAEVLRRVGQRGAARDAGKRRGDWLAGLDLSPPLVPHLVVDAHLAPPVVAERILASLRPRDR
ncbi:MAG: AAA family ATPase [Nocardioidaceae bacterium]